MGHYAKVENGIVTNVIVAQKDFIDTLPDKDQWVKTSYNTYGGKHLLGKEPLRKNYAGVGFVYDKQRDAFYEPQPFPSWVLNEQTCIWEPPVPYPMDYAFCKWDETTKTWKDCE